MKNLSGLQCPNCQRFIYDWSQHVECLFHAVLVLKHEIAELQAQNARLRRIVNEETEG